MFAEARGKINLKKKNLSISSKNLSQSCFAYIYLLPTGFVFLASPCSFLLAIYVSHCFPNLLDYFVLLFHPLQPNFIPSHPGPLLLLFSQYFFASLLCLIFSLFFISPLLFLFITCLSYLLSSHPFLSYSPSFISWIKSFHSLFFSSLLFYFPLVLFSFCHLPITSLVFLPFLLLPSFCPLMPRPLDPLPESSVG